MPRHGTPEEPPRNHDTDARPDRAGPTHMRLDHAVARARLASADHGVLCTVHPVRGVDAVPVVFVVDDDDFVGIPVDVVKPKASTRLQRERNLEADPRATLLVEHWAPSDWTRLWWARAELRWDAEPPPGREASLSALLARRYPQYRDEPFVRVLVLRLTSVTGWAARDDAPHDDASLEDAGHEDGAPGSP